MPVGAGPLSRSGPRGPDTTVRPAWAHSCQLKRFCTARAPTPALRGRRGHTRFFLHRLTAFAWSRCYPTHRFTGPESLIAMPRPRCTEMRLTVSHVAHGDFALRVRASRELKFHIAPVASACRASKSRHIEGVSTAPCKHAWRKAPTAAQGGRRSRALRNLLTAKPDATKCKKASRASDRDYGTSESGGVDACR
jgi:hypothetical protein